jgi:RNA polymerase sigma-70 factor (ECF subfamily)
MSEQDQELQLLERLKAGDQSAYAELVDEHAGRIYNLALRMLGDEAAAEDVLQETFLNAFKAIERFEGRSSLGTWLYRIANNAALMQIRKREPQSFSMDAPVETDEGEQIPRQFFDFCCLPEREMLTEEAYGEMRAAIDELPEGMRVVFVLRDIEGLSTQETADELGLSVPAVKTRLMRARLALRERLADYFAHSSVSTETGDALSKLS